MAVLLLGLGIAGCSDDDEDSVVADDSAEEPAGAGSAITIAGFAFDPETTEVTVGSTVTVTNDDSASHTWTADDGSWDSEQLGAGDEFEHTFDEAGTFAYHCELHSTMKGTVVVS